MSGPVLNEARLLEFSRKLHFANDYDAMLNELCNEVRAVTDYETAWIGVYLPEQNAFKILTLQAEGVPVEWDAAQTIPIDFDPYLSRIVEDRVISIVEDAQTDPTVNREVVAQLGNRTVVNIPMAFGDVAFGALGTGSFGDEGVRLPTSEQLDYLQKLANTVTAASVRILKLEQRRSELRERSSAAFDEIASLLAAIESDASSLSGEAKQVGDQILERSNRIGRLIDEGRIAMQNPV